MIDILSLEKVDEMNMFLNRHDFPIVYPEDTNNFDKLITNETEAALKFPLKKSRVLNESLLKSNKLSKNIYCNMRDGLLGFLSHPVPHSWKVPKKITQSLH